MSQPLDIHNPHKSKARTEKYDIIFEGFCFRLVDVLFKCLFVCLFVFFSLNVVEVRTIQTGFTTNGLQMDWGVTQYHNLAVLKMKLTVTLMSLNTLIQSFQRYYYGGPWVSRHNQKPSRLNQISHSKTKQLTAQPKTVMAQPNISRHNQTAHGTTKNSHSKTEKCTQKQITRC